WYDEVLQRAAERGGGADAPARVQLAIELVRWGEEAEAGREAARALDALAVAGDRWTILMPWLEPWALWALARGGGAGRAPAHGENPRRHTVALARAARAERAGDSTEAQRLARAAFEYGARERIRALDSMLGTSV